MRAHNRVAGALADAIRALESYLTHRENAAAGMAAE
jgi:hypothetical protein